MAPSKGNRLGPKALSLEQTRELGSSRARSTEYERSFLTRATRGAVILSPCTAQTSSSASIGMSGLRNETRVLWCRFVVLAKTQTGETKAISFFPKGASQTGSARAPAITVGPELC